MRDFSRVSLVIGLLFWIAGALPVRACSLCSVEAGDGAMRQAFLKGESVELRRGPGPAGGGGPSGGDKDPAGALAAPAGGGVGLVVIPDDETDHRLEGWVPETVVGYPQYGNTYLDQERILAALHRLGRTEEEVSRRFGPPPSTRRDSYGEQWRFLIYAYPDRDFMFAEETGQVLFVSSGKESLLPGLPLGASREDALRELGEPSVRYERREGEEWVYLDEPDPEPLCEMILFFGENGLYRVNVGSEIP